MASINLREFVDAMLPKIDEAGQRGDHKESARLLKILAEECLVRADKIERHKGHEA